MAAPSHSIHLRATQRLHGLVQTPVHLTPRAWAVFRLRVDGLRARQIAAILGVGETTVRTYDLEIRTVFGTTNPALLGRAYGRIEGATGAWVLPEAIEPAGGHA